MQSFYLHVTGPASLKVVQKTRIWGSEPFKLCFYSRLHQRSFFWGRKGHLFFSVLGRECMWVWYVCPQTPKSADELYFASAAREELWLSFPVYSLLGTWFIVAWLELGCPLRQRGGTVLEVRLKYTWSLKKKKIKMTSEEWGSAEQSFISYPLSQSNQNFTMCQQTPLPQAVGVRHLNSVSLPLSSYLNTPLQLTRVFEYVSKNQLAPCWIFSTQKKFKICFFLFFLMTSWFSLICR